MSLLARWMKKSKEEVKEWLREKFADELEKLQDADLRYLDSEEGSDSDAGDTDSNEGSNSSSEECESEDSQSEESQSEESQSEESQSDESSSAEVVPAKRKANVNFFWLKV